MRRSCFFTLLPFDLQADCQETRGCERKRGDNSQRHRFAHCPSRPTSGHSQAYFFAKNARAKVLLVGEAMVFDLDGPIEYATVFDRNPWEEIAWEGDAGP